MHSRNAQSAITKGLIQPNGSWKRFLKIHWDSLFIMDFMTVDTLLGKRFYLLIILELKTRKIVRFDMTENPCREFVKQRIDYTWYGIKGVNISTAAPKAGRKQAFYSPLRPCMNAYVERLNGTIRREALDHFLLFSEKQVRNIIRQYVEYYNKERMHQGIKKIPDAELVESSGVIKKIQILSGLHHHYYRSSA